MKRVCWFFFRFLPVIITLAIQTCVVIPVAYYYIVINGAINGLPDMSDGILKWLTDLVLNSEYQVYVTVIWALISMLVFILWYRHIHDKNDDVPIRDTLSPFSILGTLLMVLGLQIAIQYAYSVWENLMPEYFSFYNNLMDTTKYNTVGVIVMGLYGVFVAPIHEEYLNRGVTLHFAKKALPFWAANILQAALFGILHMNLIQGSYAFVIGIVIGYIYKASKNIWFPIIFHMTFNLFGTVMSLAPLNIETTSAYMLATIIGLAIFSSGALLFRTQIEMRNNNGVA